MGSGQPASDHGAESAEEHLDRNISEARFKAAFRRFQSTCQPKYETYFCSQDLDGASDPLLRLKNWADVKERLKLSTPEVHAHLQAEGLLGPRGVRQAAPRQLLPSLIGGGSASATVPPSEPGEAGSR